MKGDLKLTVSPSLYFRKFRHCRSVTSRTSWINIVPVPSVCRKEMALGSLDFNTDCETFTLFRSR